MSKPGGPFRALAGLGLGLAIWIAVRLPAMQRDVVALAALAAPPAVLVQQVAPGNALVRPERTASSLARPARLPAASTRPARLWRAVAPPLPEKSVLEMPPIAVDSARPPAGSTRPPIPPVPAAAGSNPAFSLAAQAYDRLRNGQRRQAAALFDAALELQPGNRQWQADRRTLARRWQLGGYALLRDGGEVGPAASPVLGGGQIGASLAFLPDPYARSPLALTLRANAAADSGGVRGETAQLAVGVRQPLLPGVSVSIERLVPLDDATRGAFTARLAAGGRWHRLEGYGEAGVLDTGQIYAGGQARVRLIRVGPATLHAATWASVQTGAQDVWRVDVGPAITSQIKGIRLEADWRQKVAGNAAPGSGPVLTISAGF